MSRPMSRCVRHIFRCSYVYDLKQDTVQPSQRLQPPVGGAASGATTAIAFAGGGESVMAHGMSSGHVIIWRLPASLAVGGGGEGDDAEVLSSIFGGDGEEGAAAVGDGEEDFLDFTPAVPAPLTRLAEVAEPAAKPQQQQQQQQQQRKQQPVPAPAAHSSSAADSDGGDSLDGDTPW